MKLTCQCCVILAFLAAPIYLGAQQPTDTIPEVLVRTNPKYPPIAKTAHIEGDVRVKVTTDGSSVVNAEAESGPPLLQKNTLESVRTWKFANHTPSTFHLEFQFRLMTDDQIVLEKSPGVFEIVAKTYMLDTSAADSEPPIDLGKWQARIQTKSGVLRKTFWLSKGNEHVDSIEVKTK